MGRATGTVEKYLYSSGTERHQVVSARMGRDQQRQAQRLRGGIASDMIGWIVPLERFSGTYNNEPNQLYGPPWGYLCLHD
jgi:hypothetical protein